MAVVPEGKRIWIGNKRYEAGDKLPDSYKLSEKKKKSSGNTGDDKKEGLV